MSNCTTHVIVIVIIVICFFRVNNQIAIVVFRHFADWHNISIKSYFQTIIGKYRNTLIMLSIDGLDSTEEALHKSIHWHIIYTTSRYNISTGVYIIDIM